MRRGLIGRDAERQELANAVDHGKGALIWGAAGVGKTALAAAVADQVARHGTRVDWVVATRAAHAMPFGALAPLLLDDLTGLHPAPAVATLARRLRETAGKRLPLLIVDDAHLLDDASAVTVLGLVTSGAARVLLTVRSGEPTPDAIGALWKDGFVETTMLAPFDRTTTRSFLSDLLDGEVALTTAELFWRHTRGNALYLSELAKEERSLARLVDAGGVWVWLGKPTVPPRLADLLAGRFAGLTDAGRDALGALALGEPLATQTLAAVVSAAAVAELEERGLVEIRERHGRSWYHFVHPLIASAAVDQLTPTRRRRMADALIGAPSDGVDPLRSALWQLDGTGPPDAGQLLAGARRVLLTEPDLARRFVERVMAVGADARAELLLADVHAELGDLPAARRALVAASAHARSMEDRIGVALNQASLITFLERSPDLALGTLDRALSELSGGEDELGSFRALILLFAARPADALVVAEQVLARSPSQSARLRAAAARVGALALVDRANEALGAARNLLVDVDANPVSPYVQSFAFIVSELARFVAWEDQYAPAVDPAARGWPLPRVADDVEDGVEAVAHPLFAGARLLLEGDLARALPLLREGVTQQQSGRCLLRSEAVNMLIRGLAASGDLEGATRLLATQPPDRVAMYPGLELSSRAAVEAAAGRPASIDLALAAAEEAIRAGGTISAVAYLADAARYGGAIAAAERLDRLDVDLEAVITHARALYVRARAGGDGTTLLEAAEAHAAIGLAAGAAELAQLAAAALSRNPARVQRAVMLAREMRRRLRHPEPGVPPAPSLTQRELEVARLAANGMSSREISSVLLVSVRTVESHLASTYRKLDIRSRHSLRPALAARR